jgi:nitroreductase
MSDTAPDTALPAIELFDAIYTARSLRRFRPDPVPEALIARVLDAAIRAPSAGNAQNWHFVVVRDAEQRRKIGALYRKGSDIAAAVYQARGRPPHLTDAQWRRMMVGSEHLWNHMGDAPVLLVPCLRQRDMPARDALDPDWRQYYDSECTYLDRIRGASIYPAVQNVILACRALGLGTVLTTNHLRVEPEFKAVLGIPADVDTFALMPIGWPEAGFGPLSRRPLAEVRHDDRW